MGFFMRLTILAIFLCALFCKTFSMDGAAIAYIKRDGKQSDTRALVRYDIEDDIVVGHDTLYDVPLEAWIGEGAECPTINMSGTYAAFLMDINDKRHIGIMSLQGGGTLVKVPTVAHARYLHWMPNGSILYFGNDNPEFGDDRCYNDKFMRRLTLKEVNGKLTFEDTIVVKMIKATDWNNGIARDESKFIIRAVRKQYGCVDGGPNNTVGFLWEPDTNNIAPQQFNTSNCGAALSPSGKYWHHHPGDHDKNAIKTWDNNLTFDPMDPAPKWESTDPDAGNFKQIDDYNRQWAKPGPNDPLKNLECNPNGKGWEPWPIGFNSNKPGWSCNSDHWYWTMLNWVNGKGANFCVFNFKTKTAVNVTKIPPQKDNYSMAGGRINYDFRGISFGGGDDNQVFATRGMLWCKSQEDVWDQLYEYIQNQSTYRNQWADLLGLDVEASSGILKEDLGPSHSTAALPQLSVSPSFDIVKKNGTISLRLSSPGVVDISIYDMHGRLVMTQNARGRALEVATTGLNQSYYVLQVKLDGQKLTSKMVHVR
ncbi:MAG: T9SS type A sorting domain-containing protein [Chitinivibrionales bacterium]|nr:T9SS type A sorting domain-containing protein [Chitinivibrionales bacterium]